MRALVFPGQGSQQVGMGKALAGAFPIARQLFEEVDEALSFHLSRLMFEGPEETLTLTQNAQPAILASSLALLRVMEREAGFRVSDYAAYAAGHSLGEYTALAATGVLPVAASATLVRRRGEAMQQAVPPGIGAMAALIGLERDAVTPILAEVATLGVCVIANDNAPGQIVISGVAAAVDAAITHAKARGAKRAVMLAVSAPFHSPLMAPAARAMEQALGPLALHTPSVPIIANVTAAPVHDPEGLRRLLVEQVTGMVRWRESVQQLTALGVESVLEIGIGNVLTGLIKRIDKNLLTQNVATPEDIDQFVKVA